MRCNHLFFILSACLSLFQTALYANNNGDYSSTRGGAETLSGSLTFAQAANLAVAASADLRHARASQTVMEGMWRWGLRAYFPRMNISVSENDRLQQNGPDSFMKNYVISLDQLIWDGGRISMSRNLERMELDLSSSRLERMALETAESAISAYRNILSSRAILEIRNSALSVLEEQRRIINEEVQLGLALAVDLADADINIAGARIDLLTLRLELSEMERQFAELLGLESPPALAERVDVNRSTVLPAGVLSAQPGIPPGNLSGNQQGITAVIPAAAVLAREQNPDLVEARYSIAKRQAELNYASASWVPTLRLVSNFGLTGQNYPLTRFNWSFGINIEFSSPWFQNRFNVQAGWESSSPGQFDRTASAQNNLAPLPDPSASYGTRQARLALDLERERYNSFLERLGRIAANAVEKCVLAERRRVLALEASSLGVDRCRIDETRLALGQITRTRLMESLIEQTQREIAAVQAATALLEAERELERFLDLEPGGLSIFINTLTALPAQRTER